MREDSILDFIIVMEAMKRISRSDKNVGTHCEFYYKRMQKHLKMFNNIASNY